MQHQASLKDEPRLDQVLTPTGFAELIAKGRALHFKHLSRRYDCNICKTILHVL